MSDNSAPVRSDLRFGSPSLFVGVSLLAVIGYAGKCPGSRPEGVRSQQVVEAQAEPRQRERRGARITIGQDDKQLFPDPPAEITTRRPDIRRGTLDRMAGFARKNCCLGDSDTHQAVMATLKDRQNRSVLNWKTTLFNYSMINN